MLEEDFGKMKVSRGKTHDYLGIQITYHDGKIFSKINGEKKELFLKECNMPFKTNQRTSA